MTNAEKEARALVCNLANRFAVAEGYGSADDTCWPFHDSEWADRILRFAHEYGPDLAREERRRLCSDVQPSWRRRRGAPCAWCVRGMCPYLPVARTATSHTWTCGTPVPPLAPVEDTTPPGWERRDIS